MTAPKRPTVRGALLVELLLSIGISVLAPNSWTLYTRLGTPAHNYSLWRGPGLGTESRLCQCEPPTAGRGLSIRFCWTPLRPPLGSGSISRLPQPRLSRRKRQHRDPREHTAKQPFRQMALRQQ